MKHTTPGKYYSWFNDETWEEALESHNIDGFDDLHWAIAECMDSSEKVDFKIVDHEKNIVFDSTKYDRDFLETMVMCTANKFYVKFNNESLRQAIQDHSVGFDSIEDAHVGAIEGGDKGEGYEIYNHKLEVVAKSIIY